MQNLEFQIGNVNVSVDNEENTIFFDDKNGERTGEFAIAHITNLLDIKDRVLLFLAMASDKKGNLWSLKAEFKDLEELGFPIQMLLRQAGFEEDTSSQDAA